MIRTFSRWAAEFGASRRPWLILGKGPSYAQVDQVDTRRYGICTLNHVIRERAADLAHVIDLDVVETCATAIEANARFLVMPWLPHVNHTVSRRNLAELLADVPVLRRMAEQGRLLCYNLSSARKFYPAAPYHRSDAPWITARYFSAEAAVGLLAESGVREIRTLGVDGGSAYAMKFHDIAGTTLLANGHSSFDGQFAQIRDVVRHHGIHFGPLDVQVPARVFVGADETQTLAFRVLEYSIRRHANLSVQVERIDNDGLPAPRDSDNRARTGFSFCRFKIPALCGYVGRAVYLDADMLVFADLLDLWRRDFGGVDLLYSEYAGDQGRIPQYSVLLLNCATLQWNANDIVRGLDEGRYDYGQLMHQFCLVPAQRRQAGLPFEWNSLEHYEPGETKLIHFTDMPTQPWVSKDNRHGAIWWRCLREAIDAGEIARELVEEEVERGHVSPELPGWIGLKPLSGLGRRAAVWRPPYLQFSKATKPDTPGRWATPAKRLAPTEPHEAGHAERDLPLIGWLPKSADPNIASVRFRCLKPVEGLTKQGQAAELFSRDRASSYAVVVFSKQYDRRCQELAERLRRRGTKVVLDLCDNHFYNPYALPEYERTSDDQRRMMALCDLVICSTAALAEVVRHEGSLTYTPPVVGDPIELAEPPPRALGGDHRNLLWFGVHGSPNAPSGMTDLLRIAPLLLQLSRRYSFELVVASNSQEKYDAHIAPLPFTTRYVEWTAESFVRELAQADGVLLPISFNPYTLCKSNNRLATALFANVPVVADPIPSYREFRPYCHLGDWKEGLAAVLERTTETARRTAEGQALVRQRYSVAAVSRRWADVLAPYLRQAAPAVADSAPSRRWWRRALARLGAAS